MAQPKTAEIQVFLEEQDAGSDLARDVRDGLSRRRKRLPSKYFYDKRGSELFEAITRLPEYYLTRTERSLLETVAVSWLNQVRPERILELGSGAASKTRVLLDAGRAEGWLSRFEPLEFSRDMARRAAQELAEAYPGIELAPMVGDFEKHLDRIEPAPNRLVVFLGSTLGNFEDHVAAELLRGAYRALEEPGWLLLGTDLVKDRKVIEAAYNDAQGVTAEFNRNLLHALNRDLNADFDPQTFEHVAFFNEEESWIESHLRSTKKQTVRIHDLEMEVHFERGEGIFTEISRKYTPESIGGILEQAGFRRVRWATDDKGWFGLSLAERA